MTEFIAPATTVGDDHDNWINTNIETINEANVPLIPSSVRDNSDISSDDNEDNNNVITPDCEEKFRYLGQTDINRIITVASFSTKDGDCVKTT